MIGAELAAADPAALAERWGHILDCPPRATDAGHIIELTDSRLRFVHAAAGEPEGLVAFEFRAQDAERAIDRARRLGVTMEPSADALAVFVIAGVRLRLLAA